jgi:hypothetical protein
MSHISTWNDFSKSLAWDQTDAHQIELCVRVKQAVYPAVTKLNVNISTFVVFKSQHDVETVPLSNLENICKIAVAGR